MPWSANLRINATYRKAVRKRGKHKPESGKGESCASIAGARTINYRLGRTSEQPHFMRHPLTDNPIPPHPHGFAFELTLQMTWRRHAIDIAIGMCKTKQS
jgi:hypothetical protein